MLSLTLTVLLIGAAIACGAGVLKALKPVEGYEDEFGFHEGKAPQAARAPRIQAPAASVPVVSMRETEIVSV